MKIDGLENVPRLSSRVAVYVPSTIDTDQAVDTAEYVKQTAAKLSELFGGATAQLANGYWISDKAGLVEEKTTIIYSYSTPEQVAAKASEVIDLARRIKEQLRQEAVSLEIDNELYLI